MIIKSFKIIKSLFSSTTYELDNSNSVSTTPFMDLEWLSAFMKSLHYTMDATLVNNHIVPRGVFPQNSSALLLFFFPFSLPHPNWQFTKYSSYIPNMVGSLGCSRMSCYNRYVLMVTANLKCKLTNAGILVDDTKTCSGSLKIWQMCISWRSKCLGLGLGPRE